MQGKVLGFSGDSGAITGDDGSRYNFSRGDWKGEQEPRPQVTVDFVVGEDGKAKEIYPLKRTASVGDLGAVIGRGSEELSRLAASEGAQDIAARIKAAPGIAIAAFVILFSLIFSYLNLSLFGENSSSLIGFATLGSSELGDIADIARARAEDTWFMAEEDRNFLRGAALMFDGLGWLAVTLLVVPGAAVWTIYRGLRNKSTRISEILTVAGIGWALVYSLVARETVALLVGELSIFMSPSAVRDSWSLGLGGYLLLVLAVVTVLNLLGKLSPKTAEA